MDIDPAHVEWSRRHFATMKDGGVWGVPRSGLIFQRRDGELVLIDRMPHTEEMPVTPEQLAEQQRSDIAVITAHFGAAGIVVR